MTGPGGCQRSQDVKEFIILTDFSRCQADLIGRVSAALKKNVPLFETVKDFA
jgi:hypothetical protein